MSDGSVPRRDKFADYSVRKWYHALFPFGLVDASDVHWMEMKECVVIIEDKAERLVSSCLC